MTDQESGAIVTAPHTSWAPRFEAAFSILALLAGTIGPVYQARFRTGPFPDPYDKDQLASLVFAAFYVTAGILGGRASRPLSRAPLVVAGVLGATLVASTIWSYDRVLTATHALQMCFTLVVPWYLARRWSVRQIATMAWAAATTGVALSLTAVALGWVLALDVNGHWAGIYFNRNSLGPVAASALALGCWVGFTAEATGGVRMRLLALTAWATVPVSAFVLFKAGSKTSMIAAAAALTAWILTSLLARVSPPRYRSPAIWGTLVIGAIALAAAFRPIARLLGSDDTLQGRTEVWGYVSRRFVDRPLTGDGFMATYTTWDYWYWGVDHLSLNVQSAHNGVLEVATGGGVVALGALLILLLMGVDTSVRAVISEGPATPTLLIAVFFLVADSAETFIGAHHFLWVLFLATCVLQWRRPASSEDTALTVVRSAGDRPPPAPLSEGS